ncbi:hypothetical protein [Streptomyces abyssalis]|nr:hypothetical protein [Streptomyces abyssalis]
MPEVEPAAGSAWHEVGELGPGRSSSHRSTVLGRHRRRDPGTPHVPPATMDGMSFDIAALELATQRWREAAAALDAARTDLEAVVAQALREDGGEAEAAVAEVTGWSRERMREAVAAVDEREGHA